MRYKLIIVPLAWLAWALFELSHKVVHFTLGAHDTIIGSPYYCWLCDLQDDAQKYRDLEQEAIDAQKDEQVDVLTALVRDGWTITERENAQ